MLSLLLRNLFFTILQPGIVAGLVPYWLLGSNTRMMQVQDFRFYHYSGLTIFVTGFIIMLHCIINFAVKGTGTLSPADPTKRLVVTGLYKYSRNPMYIGVIMILIGEAIFFQSRELWIYSGFVFIAFNIFILVHEEPRLRKVFGEEYNAYCRKVRRWL